MRGARPCPVCGAIFEPRKVGGAWTKTCSRRCGYALIAQKMREGGGARASVARKHVPRVECICEVCGRRWELPPSQARGRRFCSLACAAEGKRRAGGDERRGARNPNWRHGRREGQSSGAGRRRWRVALEKRCAACGAKGPRLDLHHIVYRQHVIRAGGDLWDPRNGITLCASCHASHHHRGRVLSLALLPDAAYNFCAETLGPGPAYEYLRRRYIGEDARLDVLLRRYHPPDSLAIPNAE